MFPIIMHGQTFIEMSSPEDASIILLEVTDKSEADLLVYKTDSKQESNEWDLKWKFRRGGFSNFGIYIAKDLSELFLTAEEAYDETSKQLKPHAKVYFVDAPDSTRYQTETFRLEGVMRIKKSGE